MMIQATIPGTVREGPTNRRDGDASYLARASNAIHIAAATITLHQERRPGWRRPRLES